MDDHFLFLLWFISRIPAGALSTEHFYITIDYLRLFQECLMGQLELANLKK